MVLLTVLTILLVLSLVAVLVGFLVAIIGELEAIGGHPDSLLARVRWGVRAIERQTDALEPQVTKLNGALGELDDGLADVAGHVGGLVDALDRQDGGGGA